MHHMSDEMQSCIDENLRCYQTCLSMAMNHCLEVGGEHARIVAKAFLELPTPPPTARAARRTSVAKARAAAYKTAAVAALVTAQVVFFRLGESATLAQDAAELDVDALTDAATVGAASGLFDALFSILDFL